MSAVIITTVVLKSVFLLIFVVLVFIPMTTYSLLSDQTLRIDKLTEVVRIRSDVM